MRLSLCLLLASGCSLLHPYHDKKDEPGGGPNGGPGGGPTLPDLSRAPGDLGAPHDLAEADARQLPDLIPPPPQSSVATGAAATQGTIAGVVLDAVSKAPLPGASVQVSGGPSATSGSDGSFTLTVPSGRAHVAVSASGHLDWAGDLGAGATPLTVRVRLFPKAAAQAIAPTGGTLTAGAASLLFPSGAFSATTNVSATFVDRGHVGALSGPAQWVDAGGARRRVIGYVHVETPTEPSVPVTVSVPVPTRATASNVVLYDRAPDGTRTGPLLPTSVSGGVASFSVSHFSDDEIDDQPDDSETSLPAGDTPSDTVASGFVASDVPDGTQATYADASGASHTTTVNEGDVLSTVSNFVVSSRYGQTLVLVTPSGDSYTISGGSNLVLSHVCVDATCGTSTQKLVLQAGSLRAVDTPSLNAPRALGTKACGIGVRGTVFTLTAMACLDPMHEIDSVEVVEGAVDVTPTGGATTSLTAGQSATLCAGCAPSAPAACPALDCPDSTARIFAGSGASGFVDGVGTNAQFSAISGLLIDSGGTLYVRDALGATPQSTWLEALRRVTQDQVVSTVQQPHAIADDHYQIALDRSNRLYLLTSSNPSDFFSPQTLYAVDAVGNQTVFASGLHINDELIGFDQSGKAYFRDDVPAQGVEGTELVTAVQGGGQVLYSGTGANMNVDGPASSAAYAFEPDCVVSSSGDIYMINGLGGSVGALRHVASDGSVTTLGHASYSWSSPLYLDEPNGVLYIDDQRYPETVFEVDLAGNVLASHPRSPSLAAACLPVFYGPSVSGKTYRVGFGGATIIEYTKK